MIKLDKCDGLQDAGLGLALPLPAQHWHQHDSESIFFTLEVYLTTFFSEIFCFTYYFLGQDVTGRDGNTERHMDRQTFLEKYLRL